MSFSADFDAIQEMRRLDDPSLSQGEWITELKTADWAGAAAACEALLRHKTKDLRVAGWLLESWAQTRGYAGLADGLELARGLCERFWADLHPQAEDGDLELRAGALSRLLVQVTGLARTLPVVGKSERFYSLIDMETARALQAALAKARDPSEVPTAGKATVDDIQKAQRETPSSLLASRRDDCRRAQEALAALQGLIDHEMGEDGPGFGAARSALEEAAHTLERLARDAGAGLVTAPTAAAPPSAEAAPQPQSTPMSQGFGAAPTSRTEAIAQLRMVADFFRRTEPHSPVAYLAERAAHWGELPLHEWLRLVLKDAGALGQLEELLGVEPREERG